MSIELVVPQVGEAISAAVLVCWYKKEGDVVRKGDPLFAVDTAKAVLDVEAFGDGILGKILVPADSEVQPGTVVGLLRDVDELTPRNTGAPTRILAPAVTETRTASRPIRARLPSEGAAQSVSPKARRLARDMGVDLARVVPAHAGTMIVEEDINAAAGAAGGAEEIIPLTAMRGLIATRTQRSKQLVPHFYLMADVNMTAVLLRRKEMASPCSVTGIVIHACAQALEEMPGANVFFTEKGLVRRKTIDIGVAVGVEGGVLVPVARNANARTLADLDRWLKDVRAQLDRGHPRPADFGARSLTISNLGMHAVDRFIAIIDVPDPAILAVGSIQERAVVEHGAVVVRPMCTLVLSIDHRAMDGLEGARLLNLIRRQLEHFPAPR